MLLLYHIFLYCFPQILIYSLGSYTLFTLPVEDKMIYAVICLSPSKSALYGLVKVFLSISGKAGLYLTSILGD